MQDMQGYKKPNPRPTVGLSAATDFTEAMAMDLRQLSDNILVLSHD